MSDETERVLVTEAVNLTAIGGLDGFLDDPSKVQAILANLLDRSRFCERNKRLEQNKLLLQFVAYGVLVHDGAVFVYRRTAKGGEPRLHALASLGIGGHVNEDDERDSKQLIPTLTACMFREIHEEISLKDPATMEIVGLIHDTSNDVGQVHLGVVFRIEMESRDITTSEDIEPIGWYTPGEFPNLGTIEWESWSRILTYHLGSIVG